MKAIRVNLAAYWLLLLAVTSLGSVCAAENATTHAASVQVVSGVPTAHQLVEQTTQRVMAIITEAQGYFEQDPERFYQQIEGVLADVVDFDSFARGVMGPYASKQMYLSLKSSTERQQFKERMKRFSDTFREGLVRTYAKGLLAFSGNRIEVLPPTEPEQPGESVTVVQHIYGEADKPYVVHYKLRQNPDGEWKLRNVTIEAINLGKVYQSQFASAAKQYNGDIDKVIANWTVDPTASDPSETATADAG